MKNLRVEPADLWIIHDSNANYNEVPYYPVSGTDVLIIYMNVCYDVADLCFFSPDARRATGEVVHLDWELLEVVDAGIQL